MYKSVHKYLERCLEEDDEDFKNGVQHVIEELDKSRKGPQCQICEGFGHQSGLKCGYVKTYFKELKRMGYHTVVNQLKKELKFQLNNQNRFEFGQQEQYWQSENNEQSENYEAQVENVLLSSESSNQKAKKLANKLRRKSEQAHNIPINTSDCLLDDVLVNNSLVEQDKTDGISKNKKRRLIKMCDLSMVDS